MRILIVEHDDVAAQLLKSKLEALGHEAVVKTSKNDGIERMREETFDVLFLDPSPLKSARPAIHDIRRKISNYVYVFLTLKDVSQLEALQDGVNNVFPKPFVTSQLEDHIHDAQYLLQLVNQIRDNSSDFPSSGGVIAKSAYNQLFLSALDRASRYGEKTYILLIAVSNYDEILKLDGKQGADLVSATLSKQLVLTRRQSDIVGQIAANEYALLLQRPGHENEPVEAIGRFTETLGAGGVLNELKDIGPIQISLELIEIPSGKKLKEHSITIDRRK